ncbi:hypothetical protein LZ32DRAFT_319633 [Colletotrichum eremochloae]|nr:hypothetical protein LZ32DRAFT_319633 [Colletotrichum eremochloae]
MHTASTRTRRSFSLSFISIQYCQHCQRAISDRHLLSVVSPFSAVSLVNFMLHPVFIDNCPRLGASANLSCRYSSMQGATAGSSTCILFSPLHLA